MQILGLTLATGRFGSDATACDQDFKEIALLLSNFQSPTSSNLSGSMSSFTKQKKPHNRRLGRCLQEAKNGQRFVTA
jgi:hypothetical protein